MTDAYVAVTSHGVFGPFNNPDVATTWLRDNYPRDAERDPNDLRGVYKLKRPDGVADLFITGADLRNAAQQVIRGGYIVTQDDDGASRATVDARALGWLEMAVRSDG